MRLSLAAAVALIGTSATAMGEFGTEDQAREIAAKLTEIIRSDGVDAAISAMHDSTMPFATSQMGIHVFEQSIIVADNREPELIATSYTDLEDLTGEAMWPRIVAAADTSSEARLEWYHYDTQAEYTYQCHSEWSVPGDIIVMVCR